MMDTEFRTFCHINDYGEYGYRRLHRLVASSKPVLLWSPSSVLLRSRSSISARDYVRLIENGAIRIIGREDWLLDSHARNLHRWEGASWDNYIDEAIRRIYIWDLYEPDFRKKRVIVTENEPGQEWAEAAIDGNSAQIDFWQDILKSEDVAGRIPPATLEAIREQGLDPEAAAIRILRDARNHGQAIQDARADTPFLLSPTDAQFLEILAKAHSIHRSEDPTMSTAAAEPEPDRTLDVTNMLAAQLMDILEQLDDCRGRRGLTQFFKHGHEELVAWLIELKVYFSGHHPVTAENELLQALVFKLRQSKRDGLRTALFDGAPALLLTGLGAASATNDIVQTMGDGSLQNLLGLAFDALLLGLGTLKTLGFVEGAYEAPHWPYLYTYGKKANRRRRRCLLDNLSETRLG